MIFLFSCLAVTRKICDKSIAKVQLDKAKPVGSTLPMNFKLNSGESPKCEKDKFDKRMVAYA